jgi:cytoskeletal protein CcmA (bactofilin family)
MRVVVIPGTTYAVTTATDCTVSTTDGVLIASCAAGEQTLFVAPGAEVDVSDDSALVTESFKGAPAGLSAVWGSIKKVSASLSSKLNVSTFNAHQANTTIHVTAQEREKWNSKQDNLTDESGNMTLAGNITVAGGTFDGTVNANGGINIPLAVGAVTDTAAVNRFYALGLAGAMSALVQPIYLNSSSITVAGSISKASNGTLAGLMQRFSVGAASAGSNAYGSAVIPLIGPNGQFNYSSIAGFSLAVSATAFAKFTFGLGRGSKTNRTGLTMDSYSMIPGDNLAVNYGEIIDVTINTPYDTVRKGYEIRVREIFYVKSVGHWQVKTTTVFLPVGHNELMPNGLNRLIYMQSGLPSTAVREEKAALYMELGGGSTNTLFKIASLRGFIAFEAGTGVSTLIIDARNEKTYALSADAGTGTRHLYANGLTNPTYHALEAMAVNAIEAEETADFEDINIPL